MYKKILLPLLKGDGGSRDRHLTALEFRNKILLTLTERFSPEVWAPLQQTVWKKYEYTDRDTDITAALKTLFNLLYQIHLANSLDQSILRFRHKHWPMFEILELWRSKDLLKSILREEEWRQVMPLLNQYWVNFESLFKEADAPSVSELEREQINLKRLFKEAESTLQQVTPDEYKKELKSEPLLGFSQHTKDFLDGKNFTFRLCNLLLMKFSFEKLELLEKIAALLEEVFIYLDYLEARLGLNNQLTQKLTETLFKIINSEGQGSRTEAVCKLLGAKNNQFFVDKRVRAARARSINLGKKMAGLKYSSVWVGHKLPETLESDILYLKVDQDGNISTHAVGSATTHLDDLQVEKLDQLLKISVDTLPLKITNLQSVKAITSIFGDVSLTGESVDRFCKICAKLNKYGVLSSKDDIEFKPKEQKEILAYLKLIKFNNKDINAREFFRLTLISAKDPKYKSALVHFLQQSKQYSNQVRGWKFTQKNMRTLAQRLTKSSIHKSFYTLLEDFRIACADTQSAVVQITSIVGSASKPEHDALLKEIGISLAKLQTRCLTLKNTEDEQAASRIIQSISKQYGQLSAAYKKLRETLPLLSQEWLGERINKIDSSMRDMCQKSPVLLQAYEEEKVTTKATHKDQVYKELHVVKRKANELYWKLKNGNINLASSAWSSLMQPFARNSQHEQREDFLDYLNSFIFNITKILHTKDDFDFSIIKSMARNWFDLNRLAGKNALENHPTLGAEWKALTAFVDSLRKSDQRFALAIQPQQPVESDAPVNQKIAVHEQLPALPALSMQQVLVNVYEMTDNIRNKIFECLAGSEIAAALGSQSEWKKYLSSEADTTEIHMLKLLLNLLLEVRQATAPDMSGWPLSYGRSFFEAVSRIRRLPLIKLVELIDEFPGFLADSGIGDSILKVVNGLSKVAPQGEKIGEKLMFLGARADNSHALLLGGILDDSLPQILKTIGLVARVKVIRSAKPDEASGLLSKGKKAFSQLVELVEFVKPIDEISAESMAEATQGLKKMFINLDRLAGQSGLPKLQAKIEHSAQRVMKAAQAVDSKRGDTQSMEKWGIIGGQPFLKERLVALHHQYAEEKTRLKELQKKIPAEILQFIGYLRNPNHSSEALSGLRQNRGKIIAFLKQYSQEMAESKHGFLANLTCLQTSGFSKKIQSESKRQATKFHQDLREQFDSIAKGVWSHSSKFIFDKDFQEVSAVVENARSLHEHEMAQRKSMGEKPKLLEELEAKFDQEISSIKEKFPNVKEGENIEETLNELFDAILEFKECPHDLLDTFKPGLNFLELGEMADELQEYVDQNQRSIHSAEYRLQNLDQAKQRLEQAYLASPPTPLTKPRASFSNLFTFFSDTRAASQKLALPAEESAAYTVDWF